MARPRPPGIIERILEAGEAVVVRDGFARASMTAIAREAGVAVGSVYHYFDDKQALLDWVIVRSLRPDLALPEELPLGAPPLSITEAVAGYQNLGRALPQLHEASARPLTGPIDAELHLVISEFCHLIERTDRVQTMVEICSMEIEELRRAWYLDYRRSLVSAYETYLRRRVEEGAIRTLDNPTFAARWIIDTTILFLRLRRLDHYPDELPTVDLADHVADMIVGGLAGRRLGSEIGSSASSRFSNQLFDNRLGRA